VHHCGLRYEGLPGIYHAFHQVDWPTAGHCIRVVGG
jgi:hypothetical protein